MVKHEEQRQYTRIRVALRVEARLECGVLVEGRAMNLSLNGLLFECERYLPLGCRVRVVLLSKEMPGSVCLECRGTVARIDEHGVAVSFERLSSDHAEQLHHLIRYHVVLDTPNEPAAAAVGSSNNAGTAYEPTW